MRKYLVFVFVVLLCFSICSSLLAEPTIIWRNYSTGDNVQWNMNGATYVDYVWLPKIADVQWKIRAVADFNADGKTDLLWRNASAGQNVVWFMNGVTYLDSASLPAIADTNWDIGGAADFNGDNKTDLLWRNNSTGENVVWFMNGSTYSSNVGLPQIADINWKIVGMGDFNSDGKADILWRNQGSGADAGKNVVWFMNGTTYVDYAWLPQIADTNWQIGGTSDFNQDEKVDLLWRNYSTGANVVWFMNGVTYVNSSVIPTIADVNWRIAGVVAGGSVSCSYSISPTNASYSAGAGSGSVSVTTGSGCNWTASSNAGWIVISSGSSGSGNGTVNYAVATNTGTNARTGSMTIAGQTFNVVQAVTSSNCVTAAAGGAWLSNSFISQNSTFTAEYDATPSVANINGIVGLSNGVQTAYSGFACLVTFNTDGTIQARNGGSYPVSGITYSAGTQYHFRLVVNITTHTYSVYVTPQGGSEQTLGSNYDFRTEQASVTNLNNWGAYVSTSSGNMQVCGFQLTAGSGDYIPPTISITAPSAGSTISGTITVSANASDNVGVVGVQFLLDSNPLGAEDTSSPYSVSLNTSTLSNGNHTLSARARDAAGNITTSSAISVSVNGGDGTAPTISMTSPNDGSTLSGTIMISATASDNVGVVGVQFLVDGNAAGVEDTTSPYSLAYDTTFLSNGSHTLSARARDAVGNTTVSSGVTITTNNNIQPTTTHPKLFWTPDWQAQWTRARNENNRWWQLIKSNADKTGTSTERYGDTGIWCTLVYQITGDTTYAQKAIPKLLSAPTSGEAMLFSCNQTMYLYDWLYNAMTSAQRSQAIALMNTIGDSVLREKGSRMGDTDMNSYSYFYLALLDYVTAPENSRAGSFLSAAFTPSGPPIGGLDSTGINRNTLRNSIGQFFNFARGGVWMESNAYNQLTVCMLAQSCPSIKRLTGVEHFPESVQYFKDAALFQLHDITPDMQQTYDWGDNEEPRTFNTGARQVKILQNTFMALSAANRNDPSISPYLNYLIEELADRYPSTGLDPIWGYGFFSYYPYDSKADWRAILPQGAYAPGMGHFRYKTGWVTDDSLFGSWTPNRLEVDHEHSYFGDFSLYRKGEWVVTSPQGCGVDSGFMRNCMMIGGKSSMWERSPIASEWGDKYGYIAGLTKGTVDKAGSWDMPPEYLHEWTRSIFYLPSADKKSDTIITYDRVDADKPTNTSKYTFNYTALKEWYIHTEVAATVSGNVATWTTTKGQQGRVEILAPQNTRKDTYNDPSEGDCAPAGEKKYTLKVMPTTDQKWDTFLNVVQISDSGAVLTNTRITSTVGEAEGALIDRGGLPNNLILFGAKQGARVMTSGYTVNWSSSASQTDVYLMDLSPSKTWTVQVDGQSAQSLSVSSQGVAKLSLTGIGSHSLKLN